MAATRDILKPPPLRRGDTIGIVAPASNVKREDLELGIARLQALGYRVVLGESVYEQDLYFAGSPQARVRDLHGMFQQPDVRAILCARGGYGSNYLLPLIDVDVMRGNPKPLIGYSDITSLLTWISDETGLVTFHGPMAAKDFAHEDGVELDSWFAALEGSASWSLDEMRGLVNGNGDGVLYGGCLSILVASLGTPYEIQTGGTILFLEDIGTKPYQVDRMLMHLKLAGKFDGVRGIIFGQMQDCFQPGGQNYTLEEVIIRVVGELGIPVAFGLPSGHVRARNVTLPFGVRARLQTRGESAVLTVQEAAVCSSNRVSI
jgi:muramoyltetrapeptide carboxypeptidase